MSHSSEEVPCTSVSRQVSLHLFDFALVLELCNSQNSIGDV